MRWWPRCHCARFAAISAQSRGFVGAIGRQRGSFGLSSDSWRPWESPPTIERDPDLASLQGTPEFARILHEFAAKRAPQGEAEIVAELPGRTGIIEGIAFRERTGDLFLSDVHHRCIWRRDREGRVARFTAEDEELLGIFGIAIDEPRNTLWAAMSAVPEMAGYTPEMKGYAALAEFNLATSELRRVIPVPVDGREHGLGDLVRRTRWHRLRDGQQGTRDLAAGTRERGTAESRSIRPSSARCKE